MGTLVQFTESGNVKVDSSMKTVSVFPLTPGTSYQFRVSALTTQGSGEEIVTTNQTISPQEDSGNHAYAFSLFESKVTYKILVCYRCLYVYCMWLWLTQSQVQYPRQI